MQSDEWEGYHRERAARRYGEATRGSPPDPIVAAAVRFPCPFCTSPIGSLCMAPDGMLYRFHVHEARIKRAARTILLQGRAP